MLRCSWGRTLWCSASKPCTSSLRPCFENSFLPFVFFDIVFQLYYKKIVQIIFLKLSCFKIIKNVNNFSDLGAILLKLKYVQSNYRRHLFGKFQG